MVKNVLCGENTSDHCNSNTRRKICEELHKIYTHGDVNTSLHVTQNKHNETDLLILLYSRFRAIDAKATETA